MLLPIPYQDPIDQGPLIEEAAGLRNPRTGCLYTLRNEIRVFLPEGVVEGPNARYQKLYDRIAPTYDMATRLYAWWKSGADATRRKAYLDLLELYDGASFLEVSVGTGANWPYLNRNLDFYGLDLSAGMLCPLPPACPSTQAKVPALPGTRRASAFSELNIRLCFPYGWY